MIECISRSGIQLAALAICRVGSYNKYNKVEDTMSRGTAIYSEKGQNS